MMKLAYAEGVQVALIKLGFTAAAMHASRPEDRNMPILNMMLRNATGMNSQRASYTHAKDVRLGRMTIPELATFLGQDIPEPFQRFHKAGGYRVAVTDEQTPQAESYSATDASIQQRNVEDIWDQHDQRKQRFVEPPWNY
jgi:hypothetical protein